ncbi:MULTISPECIES: CAP domain-containing protein [unclassified Streptomyces]|uniref:CAP domain-containing protein n=1 Tax=unclassified Streptomyces TaxID=2593676 RepID=UPI002E1655EC|nr:MULTISPECIES: CAP domain-containing protein [unclassified Streptomyces]WSR23911.1 CAP domain-containing protein [Streptomyces sp. NBC_01205]
MSRSRTPETPSRVEARRRKTVRTRIVLSVTAAAAAVAVGVAVADSDGSAHGGGRADGAAGPTSGKAADGVGTPIPASSLPTGEASATASPSPSGTPEASASATPTQPATAESSIAAKSASTQADKPTRKPTTTGGKSNGSGGSGGSGTVNSDAESAVLALVNKERAAAGCGPLASNGKLSAAARAYSDTMARSGVMSHTGPDGSTMTSRVEAAGYSWSNLGENIARGQADPDAVMNAWMNSPGHRANILNCAFKEIGIGVHKGDGGPWWTQDFGASR